MYDAHRSGVANEVDFALKTLLKHGYVGLTGVQVSTMSCCLCMCMGVQFACLHHNNCANMEYTHQVATVLVPLLSLPEVAYFVGSESLGLKLLDSSESQSQSESAATVAKSYGLTPPLLNLLGPPPPQQQQKHHHHHHHPHHHQQQQEKRRKGQQDTSDDDDVAQVCALRVSQIAQLLEPYVLWT